MRRLPLPWVSVARVAPTVLLVAGGWSLAWQARGSTDARDWLGYAVGAGLLLAVVLASGTARLPERRTVAGVGALAALALWTFVSHWWSAAPSLARDEALLTGFYAVVLALPLVTLRTAGERLAAAAVAGAGAASLALAVVVGLRTGAHPGGRFVEGRLAFPISYINAQAAAFLLGWWPAVALAARRRLPVVARAVALGAAALVGAAALLAQSKGAELGLGLSAALLLACSRGRLRLLVPLLLAGALDAAAIAPLTAPYRASPAGLDGAVRHAATISLAVFAAGVVLGAVYAAADARLDVPERTRLVAGRVVLGLTAVGVAAAVAVFLLVPRHPVGYLQGRWETFKRPPVTDTGSSHLLSLGSYRYDMWRVALHDWTRHPVAGIGGRGFAPAYLIERHVVRTPQHAHSIELEALADEGLVGFLLLAAGIGLPLARAFQGTRQRLITATAAFAASVYWLLHTSADWLWSFPATAVPFFLLLGIGASWNGGARRVPRLPAALLAALAAVFAILLCAPVWISARLVQDAETHPAKAASDLRWAHRLDPLSTQVYVLRAAFAGSAPEQLAALRHAVSMEPRQAPLRYLLGVVELNSGHRAAARAELSRALALDPGDELVAHALSLAQGS